MIPRRHRNGVSVADLELPRDGRDYRDRRDEGCADTRSRPGRESGTEASSLDPGTPTRSDDRRERHDAERRRRRPSRRRVRGYPRVIHRRRRELGTVAADGPRRGDATGRRKPQRRGVAQARARRRARAGSRPGSLRNPRRVGRRRRRRRRGGRRLRSARRRRRIAGRRRPRRRDGVRRVDPVRRDRRSNLTRGQLRQLHVQPVPPHRGGRRRPARRREKRRNRVARAGTRVTRRALRQGGVIARAGHARQIGRRRDLRGRAGQRRGRPGARRVPRAPGARGGARRRRRQSPRADARPSSRPRPRRLTALRRDPLGRDGEGGGCRGGYRGGCRGGCRRRRRRRGRRIVRGDSVSLVGGGRGIAAGVFDTVRVDGAGGRRRRRGSIERVRDERIDRGRRRGGDGASAQGSTALRCAVPPGERVLPVRRAALPKLRRHREGAQRGRFEDATDGGRRWGHGTAGYRSGDRMYRSRRAHQRDHRRFRARRRGR